MTLPTSLPTPSLSTTLEPLDTGLPLLSLKDVNLIILLVPCSIAITGGKSAILVYCVPNTPDWSLQNLSILLIYLMLLVV